MKRFGCAMFFLLFAARSLVAQVNLTGIWSGSMNDTLFWGLSSPSPCANGTPAPFTASGPSTLALAQHGSSFAGSLSLPHNWQDHRDSNGNCSWVAGGPTSVTVSGTVSGSTITASISDGNSSLPLTLSLSGLTITASFRGATNSASFTLNRQSELPTQPDLTGMWSGTMNETSVWGSGSPSPCANGTPGPFTVSGPSTLAIAQNGSSFAGSLSLPHNWHDHRDSSGNCMWVDAGPVSVTVSGTVSGSTITASIGGGNSSLPLTGSLSGSTITASFHAEISSATFTLSRADAAAPRRRAVRR